MKRALLLSVALLALTSLGISQQPPRAHDAASALRKHVFVNGKPLPANQVIVKDGVSYVDASALAEALGASVQSEETGLIIRADQPACNCDKATPVVEGEHFSERFRGDVAGVPDEIESLRAVVLKKEKVPLGPRFDAIDRKLSLSIVHVQTPADSAVYYALSYANNALAIAYYKESRGVAADEAQKNLLDSMMCSMESKFALMKGTLLPGGSCSVFKRMESQLTPKPAEPPE
ncbi:MAG: hypothetical protein WBS19_21455 [Candidatus Korobacteraceae bacterium]